MFTNNNNKTVYVDAAADIVAPHNQKVVDRQ